MQIKRRQDQCVLSVLWELNPCPRKLGKGMHTRQKPGVQPGWPARKSLRHHGLSTTDTQAASPSSRSEHIPVLLLSSPQHLKPNPTDMEEKWGPNTSFYLWSSLICIAFYFLKALVACSCREIAGFPCIRVPVKSNCKAHLCRRIKTICENCFKWRIVLIHLFIKESWCLLSVKSCGKHWTWGKCETRSHPEPPRNLNINGGGNTQIHKYTSMQLNYKLSKSHTKKP